MNFKYKSEVSKMIALLRLVNIQSFKDITLDLTRGINVIEAPNETGKSVMFKVYRTMCDANWYGRGERKSLIRRGCSKGLALLVVPKSENEVYKVLFEVYKTYQIYRLYLNDNLLDSWKQDVLPQRVQEVLGWYYDSNSKILLNLCDQELDMPFVNSNSRFNYEVMRFIIQSPELERARDNLHEWIKNCTDDLNNLNIKVASLETIIQDHKYIDTGSLKESIEKREKTVTQAKSMYKLLEALNNITELSKPEKININHESVECNLQSVEKLYNLGLTLQECIKLQKPTIREIDLTELDKSVNSAKVLNQLSYNLIQVRESMSELLKIQMLRQNTLEKIEDFEKQHEVCPLCGHQFKEAI